MPIVPPGKPAQQQKRAARFVFSNNLAALQYRHFKNIVKYVKWLRHNTNKAQPHHHTKIQFDNHAPLGHKSHFQPNWHAAYLWFVHNTNLVPTKWTPHFLQLFAGYRRVNASSLPAPHKCKRRYPRLFPECKIEVIICLYILPQNTTFPQPRPHKQPAQF